MSISEYKTGTPKFNEYKKNIISNCRNICKNSVDPGYVRDSLERCDYLYVNVFLTNVIGFATVMINDDHLYIDVICNSDRNSYIIDTLRSLYSKLITIPPSGKDMLAKVVNLAERLNKPSVKLKALTNVISYYFRYKFDFLTNVNSAFKEDRVRVLRTAVANLNIKEDEIATKIYNKEPITDEDEDELDMLNREVKYSLTRVYTRHTEGLLTEPDLRKRKRKRPTITEGVNEVMDNGFPMIYKLADNRDIPGSLSNMCTDSGCNVMGGTRRRLRNKRKLTRKGKTT